MKKLFPIIIILLIIMTSCTKPQKELVPEPAPEPSAPPTIEEKIENADYTVVAGDWVYIFNDGFECVQDNTVAMRYTTNEKIYDASEFSGEDAVYNFAAAIIAKKPTALAYGSIDKVKYAFYDGEYFYFVAGDMTTWNLDISADKYKDPYTFEEWDFSACPEMESEYGCATGIAYTFAELSAKKGAELGFVTSGRLVSVRE